MIHRIPSLVLSSALAVSALGCIPISPNDPPTHGTGACGDGFCMLGEGVATCAVDCLPEAELVAQLDGCRRDLGVADLDEQTAIVASFTRTAAHLDETGEHFGKLVAAATGVLVSLAFEPTKNPMPKEVGFDGHGTYKAKSSRVDFTASFLFGEDYKNGKKGAVIEPSLFSIENYLVGAQVAFDQNGAIVSYAQPGPLVELIGLGASPPNPFTMGLADAEVEIDKQHLRFEMRAADQLGSIASTANLKGEMLVTPAVFTKASLDMTSENPRLGQKVDVLASDLAAGTQGLRGKIQIAVRGGAFEYFATFEARVGQKPTLVLTCIP